MNKSRRDEVSKEQWDKDWELSRTKYRLLDEQKELAKGKNVEKIEVSFTDDEYCLRCCELIKYRNLPKKFKLVANGVNLFTDERKNGLCVGCVDFIIEYVL